MVVVVEEEAEDAARRRITSRVGQERNVPVVSSGSHISTTPFAPLPLVLLLLEETGATAAAAVEPALTGFTGSTVVPPKLQLLLLACRNKRCC